MVNKENYICTQPFTYAAVFSNYVDICCDMWHTAGHVENSNVEDAWHSLKFQEFRNSILDGNYKYCSLRCPHLNTLVTKGESWCFVKKEDINLEDFRNPTLKHVKLCDNETCNLRCLTCRTDFKKGNAYTTLKHLEELKKLGVERVDVMGSGEPLAISSVKHWLRSFNCSDYPKLKQIHIHSNGQLFTREMYESFSEDAKRLIKSVEISIDAASKETYEKIRRGGSWEKLMTNLNFLVNLNLKEYHFSYVVQKENYQELDQFYEIVKNLVQVLESTFTSIRYTYADCWINEEDYNRQVKLPEECYENVYSQIESILKKSCQDKITVYTNISKNE